ncbi:hypothetical protein [Marivita lacus]|nr:hypothetical protein [Marivita lacus]
MKRLFPPDNSTQRRAQISRATGAAFLLVYAGYMVWLSQTF